MYDARMPRPTKSSGKSAHKNVSELDVHHQDFLDMYYVKELSLKSIAKKFRTSVYVIQKHIRIHKLVRQVKHYVQYDSKPCEACAQDFIPTSGRSRVCKTCVPDGTARARWEKYKLSYVKHRDLWNKCLGRCEICQDELEWTTHHVDHDHATQRVRGLLCADCNQALGRFGDTLEGVMNAVNYLNRCLSP